MLLPTLSPRLEPRSGPIVLSDRGRALVDEQRVKAAYLGV
jgi:hypothetical protein